MNEPGNPISIELMLALAVDEGAHARLEAALCAGPVASVILEPVETATLTPDLTRPLVALGQKAGSAMLIETDTELARALRADGVHLPVNDHISREYEAARAWLGGRTILGADAGRSRDDAMTLGELGADYVGFGVPAFVKRQEEARLRQKDLIAWWAEIFEVPVVGMNVADATVAHDLALAGADFICLDISPGLAPSDAARHVRATIDTIADAQRQLETQIGLE
ncbi:MAG: thiamine phosphate synthase [Hyphomicrobiaceae bacterium]